MSRKILDRMRPAAPIASVATEGAVTDVRESAPPDQHGVPISLRAEGDATSNNQVSGTVIDLAGE